MYDLSRLIFLTKFENDSKCTRRPSLNLNQHHQTRLDRCNCRCCDLMVHSSTYLPLSDLFFLRLSSSLLRFRFNLIKPALQLTTPASRRFLTKIESAICKLPHFPSSPLILTPIDVASQPLAVFPRRVAMFRVRIMTVCRLRAEISCRKGRKFTDL